MNAIFWALLFLSVLIIFGILVMIGSIKLRTLAEEQEARERAQKKAIKADQERANEIHERADEAAAAKPGPGSLSERLHQSGRGRTP